MKKLSILVFIAAVVSLVFAQAGFAQAGQTFRADLAPINGSGASGTATMTLSGNQLTVNTESQGLNSNHPHAQYIYGKIDGATSNCPAPDADKDGDGFISTAEGQPSYGAIMQPLTAIGGASPGSGITSDGIVGYSQTFTVSDNVAENLDNLVLVQHGIDVNNSGKYDGEKRSDVDPSRPLEATIPTACGGIESTSLPETGGLSPLLPASALLIGGGVIMALVNFSYKTRKQ